MTATRPWVTTSTRDHPLRLVAHEPADEPTGELPRIPGRGIYTEDARLERLDWIRSRTGATLDALAHIRLDAERLTGNIENLVGAIEVPVGLAGPLDFNGQEVQGMVFAPLATTEGALVASAARGATAISRSGGVHTRVVRQRMLRAPMFSFRSMRDAFTFASWLEANTDAVRAETKLVSRHAELTAIEPVIIGNDVHVSFSYETRDAAGQNMTTACTWRACQYIVRQLRDDTGVEVAHFVVECNMSSDKKASFGSFISGRGIRVVAECVIERRVLEQVLKVTPEHLLRCVNSAIAGSAQAGMIGFNINVANTIAAMFTATGQDIACVHESSLGQLQVHEVPEGIQASITLPALIVGTVGGGTQLPAQRAMLELIGCAGPGKARRFAEIIAGFALALDLSTLSAIASGEFAAAHERLGRNRPVRFFMKDDLTPSFFQPALRRLQDDPGLQVERVQSLEDAKGSSIICELTGRKVNKLVGLFPLRLEHRGRTGLSHTDVVVKSKPRDDEVLLTLGTMAAMCGPRVAREWTRHEQRLGFAGCHLREMAIYAQTDERLRRHMPHVYHAFRDDAREAYVLVLERLSDLRLMNSADHAWSWREADISAALRGIAACHAVWYGRERALLHEGWIGAPPDTSSMVSMAELWSALAVHAAEEFPEIITGARLDAHRRLVETMPSWWPELEAMPRTLVHNDFNPRNIALREHENGLTLCAYDWELATLHVPQHDLAELLCFVLPPGVPRDVVDGHIECHREALERETGVPIDRDAWRRGYALALRDLCVNRFSLYLVAHTFRQYDFLPRAIDTLFYLLDLESAEGTEVVL